MDLVAALPEQRADSDAPRNPEGLELLWFGVSEALTDQIDAALEAAHISHKITDKEFGLLPNLEQSANFVWIDSRDRTPSRAVLEKVLRGAGALESASLFGSKAPAHEDEATPDDVVEDFDEADATAEVWAGDDEQTADDLKLSLNGVGIGCVLSDDGGKQRVRVLPLFERRAREIVREVIEGTPPE